MENKDYYVYEHIRLDNNTCFYVGKGRGERYKSKKRNSHHDRIAEKYGMIARIIKSNLSEQEAYDLEQKVIHNYVFNLGYGIDIQGYRKKDGNMLSNHTFGGDGNTGAVHTEEWKKQHSKDMLGEKNPMYGVNVWKTLSEVKRNELIKKLRERNSGSGNPMYNISPKERMDKDTYLQWLQKVSNRCKSATGANNSNYGNDTLHNKIKDNPELRIQYYSRPGSQNGRAKPISIYKDGIYINTFEYIGLCAEWIRQSMNLKTKTSSICSSISESLKSNKPYRGYTFSLE